MKKKVSIDEYLRSRILTVLISRKGQMLTEREIEESLAQLEFGELAETGKKGGVIIPSPSKVLAQLAEQKVIGSRSRTNAKGQTERLFGID